jgi:hypothetical protein
MRRVRSWGYLERSPKEAASGFGAEGDTFKADHSRIPGANTAPLATPKPPPLIVSVPIELGQPAPPQMTEPP